MSFEKDLDSRQQRLKWHMQLLGLHIAGLIAVLLAVFLPQPVSGVLLAVSFGVAALHGRFLRRITGNPAHIWIIPGEIILFGLIYAYYRGLI
ncbi:hypothetical protein [Magnetofaba australis]|uniref:Transmembrane protein n=1 Tax=Magnetofaba australis IT-1 TaxID=1434232 RepID=A0A1Y2K623_9PROT|nr:hypothetical protein [Magnetofaba australis]OSM05152.1 hypothetical protein MAIT1_03305 [Magnetofaba australis IT-1]